MSARPRPARRLAGAAVAAAALLALAACSSTAADEPAADPSASDATGASDAFPVTIEHAYGETVIESEPERVVTVSWANQDSAIALGVVPVAMPFSTYGGNDEGWLPWTEAAFAELDADAPELFSDTDGIPFEELQAAAPDVILATYSGITQEDYDTLSKIAPTIAYPDQPWATDWKTQTLTTGEALGRTAEADAIVADVEATIAEEIAAHPEIAGKSFAYLWFDSADPSTVTFYTTDDARSQFVESLGLVPAPKIVELTEATDGFYGTFSAELADQLDADIVFAYVDDEAHLAAVKADPLLSQIPAVASGAVVPLVDPTFILSTSAPSALSIPWAVDSYLPLIADAAALVK